MSEVVSIKLRVDKKLADTLRLISDKYNIDKDIIDLRPENTNLVLSVEDAVRIGNIIGDLIEVLSIVKEKTQVAKN